MKSNLEIIVSFINKINSINNNSNYFFNNSNNYILNNTLKYDEVCLKIKNKENEISEITTKILKNSSKINQTNILNVSKINIKVEELLRERDQLLLAINEKQNESKTKEKNFDLELNEIKSEVIKLLEILNEDIKTIKNELEKLNLDFKLVD